MRGIVFYQDKSSPKYLNQNSVFCYLVEKDDAYFVRLKIQYHGNDWLFVRRYIFKADTATFNYRLLDGADSKVGNGGGVMEWIDVEVGASEFEIINALANGSDCKIRYEGQYYKDRIITNKEKAALKKFAAIYPLVQLLQ